jgi:WD40 repeat protein
VITPPPPTTRPKRPPRTEVKPPPIEPAPAEPPPSDPDPKPDEPPSLSLSTYQGPASTIALSPDGKRLYVGLAADKRWESRSQVFVWDWKARKVLSKLTNHAQPTTCLALSPDGKRLVSCTGINPFARPEATLIEIGADSLPIQMLHEKSIFRVRYSPDGKWIGTVGEDHVLHVWDGESGVLRGLWKQDFFSHGAVAFSPDSKLVAMQGDKNSVLILDIAPKLKPKALMQPEHGDRVRDLQFTPDGKWLLSASDDRTIRVWDVKTRLLLGTLVGHTQGVLSLGVSAKGKYAVSGGADGTVKVWGLEKGKLLRDVFVGQCEVNGVLFTPDAKTVLASTSTGRVYIIKSEVAEDAE